MVVQDIACALMRYDSDPERIWSGQPVFSLSGGAEISMARLKKIAREKGVLYLEGEKNAGTDHSLFDAPVLALKQPQGGLELIRELFKKELVSLDSEEIVLEAQGDASRQLGPLEERFTRFLGFHPEVLPRVSRSEGGSRVREFHPSPELLHGVTQESRQAEEDLTSLRWHLSYLVHRDGKAPCTTHRFLVRQNAVILNLNHPEITSLVQLSETAPLFSGHCALALCLDEGEKIFPHLTAEAREDLILLDAMARCGRKGPFERPERTPGKAFTERAWRAFRRNAADTRRWLP